MADICGQLTTLLGKEVPRIRKIAGPPPKVSAIDVISAITGKDTRHSAAQLRLLLAEHPELNAYCHPAKLQDTLGRTAPKESVVACVKGIARISFGELAR